MSYIGLTDSYRPKQFRQVVGQPDVTIVKAIFQDLTELPPLLLFCGLSGVGKTSLARVIAAVANCESPSDKGEPCTKCASCEAVYANNHPNVEEMDAATNGSADKLRELVNRAHLQSSGIKTFIIDEAQSISAQGWNVLLKVLEEPPPNCLFVLLTSEPRKVPAKIRTRALKFNLKQVAPGTTRKYISSVVEHAKLDLTEDDINIIVDLCDGSIRDALMMVEQVAASDHTAEDIFGERDLSLDYFTKLVLKDYEGLLSTIDNWYAEVGDAKTILSQMADTLESVAHARTGMPIYRGMSKQDKLREVVDGLQMNQVAYCFEIISDWFSQTYSKAQILLMTAKMYKAVNGSTVSMVAAPTTPKVELPTSVNTPELVTADQIKEQLKGF